MKHRRPQHADLQYKETHSDRHPNHNQSPDNIPSPMTCPTRKRRRRRRPDSRISAIADSSIADSARVIDRMSQDTADGLAEHFREIKSC